MKRYIHSQRFAQTVRMLYTVSIGIFLLPGQQSYEDNVVTVMALRGVQIRMKYSGIIQVWLSSGSARVEVTFL